MSDDIRLMRVYDAKDDGAPTEGKVFLVDRLWPRGVRKEELYLDGWLKDAAPSPELRTWFGHDPERWPEFKQRYFEELRDHRDRLRELLDEARSVATGTRAAPGGAAGSGRPGPVGPGRGPGDAAVRGEGQRAHARPGVAGLRAVPQGRRGVNRVGAGSGRPCPRGPEGAEGR